MAKKTQALLDVIRRNPDNHFYLTLKEFVETRIYEIQEQLVKEKDMDEVKRLQGKADELQTILKGLTRKPVVNTYDGGFGQ